MLTNIRMTDAAQRRSEKGKDGLLRVHCKSRLAPGIRTSISHRRKRLSQPALRCASHARAESAVSTGRDRGELRRRLAAVVRSFDEHQGVAAGFGHYVSDFGNVIGGAVGGLLTNGVAVSD